MWQLPGKAAVREVGAAKKGLYMFYTMDLWGVVAVKRLSRESRGMARTAPHAPGQAANNSQF